MSSVDFSDYKIEKKATLNYKVYEILKEMIVKDDLKGNTKLNEVHIAKELGVSPTPVREAFRLLSSEGLVEIIPYKGVYVKQYTLDDIKEVYECREALEAMAIQLAMSNIEEAEILGIKNLLDENKSNSDPSSVVLVNNSLHDFIVDKSNNKRIKTLLQSLNDVLLHDRNISAYDEDRRLEIYKEHMEIVEALRGKDELKAVMAMKNHVRNGYKYIENKLKER